MLRTHTCGELRLSHAGQQVKLSGWVQRLREMGGMVFLDLRDRYGITQLSFNRERDVDLCDRAEKLGREFVISVEGKVIERHSKNKNIPTGEIEIEVTGLYILNESKTPPFTIETETDGGEDLRMRYRYLDLRRPPLQRNLALRHKVSLAIRNYLDSQAFVEVETPYLIKSTPEGARDFVVPSRMNPGEFYALPQSPQTFKQLLMVSGYDRYFQLVRCFRDEDLRADRQPEFSQVDCEMSFVEQKDVLETFEQMMRQVFRDVKGLELPEFQVMPYDEAMSLYGSDKPDLRFGMPFIELNSVAQGQGFVVFDTSELVIGITAKGAAGYSRKQLDGLTKFVQKPQIGAKGLIYVKYNEDGTFKSSVDKFFDAQALTKWAKIMEAEPGDLMLILAGNTNSTRKQLNELRLYMGDLLELKDKEQYAPLWVVDFPLLEWDEDTQRYHAMHHPFTSPKAEDLALLKENPGAVKANAYDMVINGVEVGGGSIRIHDRNVQSTIFDVLGFSREEAQKQFGFLMDAFTYGAPPHGGVAFGLDRLCALLGGTSSIRDYIAFPKNNAGRDLMIQAPATVDKEQLAELNLRIIAVD